MIGNRLRELRREHHLTQQNVADTLGIDRTSYTVYETGSSNPTLENLYKLSLMYGVSVDYLMGVSDARDVKKTSEKKDSLAVASNTDPIAMLGKEERTLLMCCRILDSKGREELVDYAKKFTKERCKGLLDSIVSE